MSAPSARFLLGGIAVALTNPGLGHALTTLFA